MCLLPEATKKNILLPTHFCRFFDLRKEFKKFYKSERPINCIKDMLDCILSIDTIRYDTVYLHGLNSWREGQLNLAHGTKNDKIRKKYK